MFCRNAILFSLLCILLSCNSKHNESVLNRQQISEKYMGEDAAWYVDNIPFFECSDKKLEEIYYYRWKMYKAHIRNTGTNDFVITEFINHVPWDREPFCTINAASMHHIHEGRWLRDDRYMNGYIRNLFQQGGNDRRYSESVADATYARYLVNGNKDLLTAQLDSMVSTFRNWSDHYDSSKHLYWIAAMPDATEYTIASIDGSGGTAGFDGGEAFRPTLNSYMYANARAISKIAAMKGNAALVAEFSKKADDLKKQIEQDLWNEKLSHFTDRFKQDNKFVHYWDLIRGRELAGMIPWYFNLPDDNKTYSAAWQHVLDTNYLAGPYGFRTNEPSYEYYFHQYVMYEGQRGSQWNGPSWPYQSSQVLTGMANLLHNYQSHTVTRADYVHALRAFALQHYLPDGKPDLVENYDPNLGGPIVYYYWSNHYNHSSFNDLIISGLCGIIPDAGDTLTIDPLADASISYFCLDGVRYHGHDLTLVYDTDGSHYGKGKGLTVYVDGKKQTPEQVHGKYQVAMGPIVTSEPEPHTENFALNIRRDPFPHPIASVNTQDSSLFQAIDGRRWYFPEIMNRWTTLGSTAAEDWYGVSFAQPHEISTVKVDLLTNGKGLALPDDIRIEYKTGSGWKPAEVIKKEPAALTGNTLNTFMIQKISTTGIRAVFKHSKGAAAITELECF